MDALVHYTACLYWLDCFYGVLSLWGSMLGQIHVGVSICVSSYVDKFVLMYKLMYKVPRYTKYILAWIVHTFVYICKFAQCCSV